MTYINVIDGDMGGGKTSVMTILAAYLGYQFPDTTIWSNYGMKGSRAFTSYKNFLEMASLESSLVLIDESTFTFDSRNFSSKGQVHFTQLLYYLRKLRVTTFFTAVDMETIDSRIRKIIDVYIYARKHGGYHWYDFIDYKSGRILKQVTIPVAKMQFFLQQLDLYKTWKIVRPTELPGKEEKDFHDFVAKLDEANERFYTQVIPGGSLRGP